MRERGKERDKEEKGTERPFLFQINNAYNKLQIWGVSNAYIHIKTISIYISIRVAQEKSFYSFQF